MLGGELSGWRGRRTKKPSVREEDVKMGQRPGKSSSWCKGFGSVPGLTVRSVPQRAAWLLPVNQADQVPSVKPIQQLSVGVLTKHFFFFKPKSVCFPLLRPFHLDWLLKAKKNMSFGRFLVADGRSYPVNRAWSHLSIVVPGSAFILHDNTGRGKTVMHHRVVLGCGQGIVFS